MNNSTREEEELLTAAEVARRFRVRRSTVYAAARRNDIPHIRLWQSRSRSLIRFRRSDIQRLLQHGDPWKESR